MYRCGRAANVAVVIVLNGSDSLSAVYTENSDTDVVVMQSTEESM
jgi:hypothetical protein